MKSVKQDLENKFPKSSIHDLELDLADSKSIECFAKAFEDLKLPLHLLINNAGVFATPKMETKDGYEFQNGIIIIIIIIHLLQHLYLYTTI